MYKRKVFRKQLGLIFLLQMFFTALLVKAWSDYSYKIMSPRIAPKFVHMQAMTELQFSLANNNCNTLCIPFSDMLIRLKKKKECLGTDEIQKLWLTRKREERSDNENNMSFELGTLGLCTSLTTLCVILDILLNLSEPQFPHRVRSITCTLRKSWNKWIRLYMWQDYLWLLFTLPSSSSAFLINLQERGI